MYAFLASSSTSHKAVGGREAQLSFKRHQKVLVTLLFIIQTRVTNVNLLTQP